MVLLLGGGGQRRAVTGGRPPLSHLSDESTPPRDWRLSGAPPADRKCSRHPAASHHLRPPLPPAALLLSIHLFVCAAFPSCPPANWSRSAPFTSAPRPQRCSLGQLLSAAPAGCCWKTSRTFRESSTTCGPVQPSRGFQPHDDGERPSFLSCSHKSVGGLVL